MFNFRYLFIVAMLAGCDSQKEQTGSLIGEGLENCEVQIPDTSGVCAFSPLSETGASQTEQTFPDGRRIIRNLTYGSRGGLMLQGDLYLPSESNTDVGALITIHGGGWEDCGRRRSAASSVALVMSGLLNVPVLNIDYRLRQEGGGYPNNVSDVMCAAQFLNQQASSYGYLPGRVALMGESAGAHLALMGALIGARADIDPGCGETPEIAAAVAVSPPTDFISIVSDDTPVAPAVKAYTGSQCSADFATSEVAACDVCMDASPSSHTLVAGATNYLIVHALDGSDPFIEDSHIDAFFTEMQSDGANIELVTANESLLTAAGCPSGSLVHGFTDCLTSVAGGAIIDVLSKALK